MINEVNNIKIKYLLKTELAKLDFKRKYKDLYIKDDKYSLVVEFRQDDVFIYLMGSNRYFIKKYDAIYNDIENGKYELKDFFINIFNMMSN